MNHRVQRVLLGLLLSAGMALAASCSKDSADGAKGSVQNKPVPVLAAFVTRQSVPIEISTFGNVQAKSTVTVKALVSGMLDKVLFTKGDMIQKDQKLFEIDPKPFEAALMQLRANKARDEAQLENSRKELVRQKELLAKGVSSSADFDKAKTDVDTFKATVDADDAAIQNAQLQLDYCTIRSRIDGRAGNLLVDEGNIVKANDMSLVTIDQIQPIEVSFSVSQRDLPAVQLYMAQGKLRVRVTPPGARDQEVVGELTFIDNTIDAATNSVKVSATFANKRELLWPGQYVDVSLELTVEKDAIVVPSQAIQSGREGAYVFVIVQGKDGAPTAEVRNVKVKRSTDGLAIIADGLNPGEQIVTDGQVRLLPGAKVDIRKEPSAAKSAPGTTHPATAPASLPKGGPVAANPTSAINHTEDGE